MPFIKIEEKGFLYKDQEGIRGSLVFKGNNRQDIIAYQLEIIRHNPDIHCLYPEKWEGAKDIHCAIFFKTAGFVGLEEYLTERKPSKDRVQGILKQIGRIIKKSPRYLLDRNSFIIHPQFIFLNDKEEVYLTYLPLSLKSDSQVKSQDLENYLFQGGYLLEDADGYPTGGVILGPQGNNERGEPFVLESKDFAVQERAELPVEKGESPISRITRKFIQGKRRIKCIAKDWSIFRRNKIPNIGPKLIILISVQIGISICLRFIFEIYKVLEFNSILILAIFPFLVALNYLVMKGLKGRN